MSEPAVIYLETDDEVTTVVRRLRDVEAGRVILVAPGRTRATTSTMTLRLLAGVARDAGLELVLVADAAARSLAADAGIAAAASIADARALRDIAVDPTPAERHGARIAVARGAWRDAPPPPSERGRSVAGDASLAETRAVPVAPPPPAQRRTAPRRTAPRGRPSAARSARSTVPAAALGAIVLLLVGAVAAVAVVLPAATIHLTPATQPLGPLAYELTDADGLTVHEESGQRTSSASGTATGTHAIRTRATGTVRLQNWNTVTVEVGDGTEVAAGEVVFTTDARVIVPAGGLTADGTIAAGSIDVPVTAAAPGSAGNVGAETIATMLTEPTASRLRGFPNSKLRVVINPDATSGGTADDLPVVQQADVDALIAAFQAELDTAISGAMPDDDARIYLAGAADDAGVETDVPPDLVGREGTDAFDLSATLHWTVRWLDRGEVEELARERLARDEGAVATDRELLPDSVAVSADPPTRVGGGVRLPVHVTAATTPILSAAEIVDQVGGLTAAEAEAALSSIGPATVDLWPGWVDRVTDMSWRVQVEIDPVAVPESSGTPAAAPS